MKIKYLIFFVPLIVIVSVLFIGSTQGLKERMTIEGSVNVFGDLNSSGTFRGNQFQAEMNLSKNIIVTNIMATREFVNIIGFSSTRSLGFTFLDTHILTINNKGLYLASHSESFTGGGNTQFTITVGIEQISQTNCDANIKTGTAGDVVNSGSSCFIQIEEGENVTLMVANVNNVQNPTFLDASLILIRIGD